MPSFMPLIVMLAACLALAGAAEAQKPRAERPTYAVGDTWVRDDGTFRVTRTDGRTYVFVARPGQEIHLTRDLTIQHTVRDGQVEVEFSPPVRLTWPLEVGKWGVASSRVLVRDRPIIAPGSVEVSAERVTWQVEAVESVAVPAGSFEAFRIAFTITASPQQGSLPLADLTMWYAPAARQLVKAQGTQGLEAVGFQLAAVPGTAGRPPPSEIAAPARPGPPPAPAAPTAAPPRDLPASRVPPAPAPPVVAAPAAAPAVAAPPGSPVAAPLQLRIASPDDKARVEHETLALAVSVSGPAGVARIVATLNGVEVVRQQEPSPRPSVALSAPLKLREGQNTLVVTAVDAAGVPHQEVRTVYYERRRAPVAIDVRYPADQQRVGQASSVVVAEVSAARGVKQVSILVNGAEVRPPAASTPGTPRSVAVTVPVTLAEGANVVVVSATDVDGAVHQEVRTIVYERTAVAAVPAVPAPPTAPPPPVRDNWAVVIGVGRYDNAAVPPLRYSVADADTVYQTLITTGGFKKENVLLLSDTSERKPTLRNIKWALGTFLARSARREDTVVIFFAGHGAPEIDPRGIERDGLAKYLIPSDADPDDLFSTALPMDDIQTIFGRIEAERIVLFLDACYSGAAGGRTFTSKKTRAGRVDDLFLERLTRSKGRAIVTASRPAEVAIELPELGHGLFTHFLLQGLRGLGDLDRDGIVTLQELYEYLEQQVTRKSRAVGGNQHPMMKGELEGVLPLVKVAK